MKYITTYLLSLCITLTGMSPAFGISGKSKAELIENKTKTNSSEIFRTNEPVGKKRALLVSISKYTRKGGRDKNGKDLDWWNLNTQYEVTMLEEVLKRKFKFDEVTILNENSQTTHDNILNVFNEKLIAPTQKGDIVYFHFSGHGMPVKDDNNDEFDGTDETLVPSDYISQMDGSKNIKDDEIAVLLDQLKKKEPANVTISMDSCFSGTATRGDILTTRGGDPLELSNAGNMGNRGDDKKTDNSASGLRERGQSLPKDYVFISAASQAQTAKEIWSDGDAQKAGGAFTFGLISAFEKSGPSTTYRDIYEQANDFIESKNIDRQTPQIEGEMDQLLMEGTALPPETYIPIKIEKSADKNGKQVEKLILQAGSLQGMTKGSKFEIYPAGTKSREEGKELAVATIEELGGLTAVLKLDEKTNLSKLKDGAENFGKLKLARAFEIEHNYDSVLKVAIEKQLNASKDGANFLSKVKVQELADTVNPEGKNWNVLIRKPFDCTVPTKNPVTRAEEPCDKEEKEFRQGLVLQRPDGTIITRLKEGGETEKQVRDALERESRLLIVKTLGETNDPNFDVELRVVPVDVQIGSDGNPIYSSIKRKAENLRGDENGQKTLAVGDYIMLEIENKSFSDLHVTILNLTPDGKIKPMFPHPKAPFDNTIKAKTTMLIPYPYLFRITEPLGQESYRIIATREKADFAPLMDPESSSATRGPGANIAAKSPIGKILMKAQEGKRSDFAGVPSSWATKAVTFTVVKAPSQ